MRHFLLCFIVLLFALDTKAAEKPLLKKRSVKANAFHIESNEPAYFSIAEETWQDGKLKSNLVKITSLDGKLLLVRKVIRNLKYPYLPSMKVEHLDSGALAEVKVVGNKVEMSFREKRGAEIIKESLALSSNLVNGAGISAFIKENSMTSAVLK